MSTLWDVFRGVVIVGGFLVFILAYFILPTGALLHRLDEFINSRGGTFVDAREQHVHVGGLPGQRVSSQDEATPYAATQVTRELRQRSERRRRP